MSMRRHALQAASRSPYGGGGGDGSGACSWMVWSMICCEVNFAERLDSLPATTEPLPPRVTSLSVTDAALNRTEPRLPISIAWLTRSCTDRESIRDFTEQTPPVQTMRVQPLFAVPAFFDSQTASWVTKAAPPRMPSVATGVLIVAPAVWLISPPTKRSAPLVSRVAKRPPPAP